MPNISVQSFVQQSIRIRLIMSLPLPEALTNTDLSLTEFSLLCLPVQLVQRIFAAILLEIVLNPAELASKLPVQNLENCRTMANREVFQYLIMQDVLEVFPQSRTIEGQRTVKLAILGHSRMVLQLEVKM